MIEIKEINKRFEDVQAVSDLTMKIVEGEIFGLVGTNGAGKSTLMRMICGILRPDEGEITVDGEQIYENPKMKEQVFYMMIAIFRQTPRPQRWKSFIADITRLLTPQDFIKCSRSLI